MGAAVLNGARDQLQDLAGVVLEPRVDLKDHRDVGEPVLLQGPRERADIEGAARVWPSPVRVTVSVGVVQVNLTDARAEVVEPVVDARVEAVQWLEQGMPGVEGDADVVDPASTQVGQESLAMVNPGGELPHNRCRLD